jgi:PPK2 family polyphosphate:nucleotide phosphotransferase
MKPAVARRLAAARLTPLVAPSPRAVRLGDDQAASPIGDLHHDDLRAGIAELEDRLRARQAAFAADGRQALLVVLQGRDASGKDGLIRTVFGACNPATCAVTAFGPPTPRELAHDFLWRVHQAVPARGHIGVFNRSHYEDVLVARVRELVPRATWRRRFEQINAFERLLVESGTVIVKVFLHVSRAEQRRRLLERLDDPAKNWKWNDGDIADRARWEAYTRAYRDVLVRCATPWAPWHIVPADSKSTRNYLMLRLLVDTLDRLDPTFPAADPAVLRAARRALE